MRTKEAYLDAMRAAFTPPDSFRPLHELAKAEIAQGTSAETLLEWHREARKRYPDEEDTVLEVMDCLVGWCAAEMRLSPPSLPPLPAGLPTPEGKPE